MSIPHQNQSSETEGPGSSSVSGHAANIIDLNQATPQVQTSLNVPTPPTVESPTKLSPIPPSSPSASTLVQPTPQKARSNSTLQSTRPAPPSPAPSRPASQILSPSPQLLATGIPSPARDRAHSNASSRGRRVSNSSHPSRASSKPRPKSTLGGPSFSASDEPGSGTATPKDSSASTPVDPSLATLPEHSTPIMAPVKCREEDRVFIKDFAFPPSDPRFLGPGYPLTSEEDIPPQPSRRSSRAFVDSPDPVSAGSSSRKGSGWSGFGLLSWRGLISRRRGSTTSAEDTPVDDDEDYRIQPDHYEDDYAFSESEPASDEGESGEPWGFYRAAFAFEAMGEHEVGMEEGDLVEVRGRGGGEGWVVAVKRRMDGQGRVVRLDEAEEGEGREGLVPESYLEKAGELEIAPPSDRYRLASNPGTSPIQEEPERYQGVLGEAVKKGHEGISEASGEAKE